MNSYILMNVKILECVMYVIVVNLWTSRSFLYMCVYLSSGRVAAIKDSVRHMYIQCNI